MGTSNNIALTSAATLARDIRRGERSPVEVVDIVLNRIENHDTVNAFTATRPDAAREEAEAAEEAVDTGQELGPLHGVPVALKDLRSSEVDCWWGRAGAVKA